MPTWPVVISLCDVLFKNRIPMELGLQYSCRYWKSVQELILELGSENLSNISETENKDNSETENTDNSETENTDPRC